MYCFWYCYNLDWCCIDICIATVVALLLFMLLFVMNTVIVIILFIFCRGVLAWTLNCYCYCNVCCCCHWYCYYLLYLLFVYQHFKRAYGLQPIMQEFQLNILGEVFELDNLLIRPCNQSLLQHPGSRFKVTHFDVWY